MTNRHYDEHLNAQRIQAFLDGELSHAERFRDEEHLSVCAECAGEVEEWQTLLSGLQDLPVLSPRPGFADRVISGLDVAAPLPWAARARQHVAAWVGRGVDVHPDGGRLQDFVEGLLPVRQAARVRTHVEACPACAREATAWGVLLGRLEGLQRLAPSDGFAARVMEHLRVPQPAAKPAVAADWRRALAWTRRLLPQTRQAWAALSGVAVTPAATLGLLIWTLVTHPTLTPGALLSFVGWKASAFAAAAWETVSASALESASAFGIYSFIESIALTPFALAGAFVAFSLATVAAVWVLYRNLKTTHPTDGRYARLSLP